MPAPILQLRPGEVAGSSAARGHGRTFTVINELIAHVNVLFAGLSGVGLPNKEVQAGETLTVPIRKQHPVFGGFLLDGAVVLEGELILES